MELCASSGVPDELAGASSGAVVKRLHALFVDNVSGPLGARDRESLVALLGSQEGAALRAESRTVGMLTRVGVVMGRSGVLLLGNKEAASRLVEPVSARARGAAAKQVFKLFLSALLFVLMLVTLVDLVSLRAALVVHHELGRLCQEDCFERGDLVVHVLEQDVEVGVRAFALAKRDCVLHVLVVTVGG